MSHFSSKPVVLCISGHDPSGGAGIQADIEAISAQDCHVASLITCLTVQDSCRVLALHPIPPDILSAQAECLMKDYKISAIKVGLIGSREIADCIFSIRQSLPDIPMVLDTVLASGSGQSLVATELIKPLIPVSTLITPNRHEARALSGRDEIKACADRLLETGAKAVLITGADESSHGKVINSLHDSRGIQHWQWQKLPDSYHGSGCTLAASIAANLARGLTLNLSVALAQEYTWQSLLQGFKPGHGQYIPGRYHS
jgi:hydroxymethylpyrimidine/phosphomethylpyrimidine kinase